MQIGGMDTRDHTHALFNLTVGQRLEPRGHHPGRRQVGHNAPDPGFVLIEGVLEGSGQVAGAAGLQP